MNYSHMSLSETEPWPHALTVKRAAPRSQLAQTLQSLRKGTGMTQEEFAAEHGFNQSALSKWESGATAPQPPNLLRLAVAHGVSVLSLLAGIDADYDALEKTLKDSPDKKHSYDLGWQTKRATTTPSDKAGVRDHAAPQAADATSSSSNAPIGSLDDFFERISESADRAERLGIELTDFAELQRDRLATAKTLWAQARVGSGGRKAHRKTSGRSTVSKRA